MFLLSTSCYRNFAVWLQEMLKFLGGHEWAKRGSQEEEGAGRKMGAEKLRRINRRQLRKQRCLLCGRSEAAKMKLLRCPSLLPPFSPVLNGFLFRLCRVFCG